MNNIRVNVDDLVLFYDAGVAKEGIVKDIRNNKCKIYLDDKMYTVRNTSDVKVSETKVERSICSICNKMQEYTIYHADINVFCCEQCNNKLDS